MRNKLSSTSSKSEQPTLSRLFGSLDQIKQTKLLRNDEENPNLTETSDQKAATHNKNAESKAIAKKVAMNSAKSRFTLRKKLLKYKKILSDIALVSGMAGLVLMLIEFELTHSLFYLKVKILS
jgi:hypothetical protein